MNSLANAKFRPVAFGPYTSHVEKRADGGYVLRSPEPLQPYLRCYTEALVYWANKAPDRTFLARRNAQGEWVHLSYASALKRVLHIAQALLDRNLNADRPLMILSENSIESALMMLAAQHVGIPFAPISPAYSLLSRSADRVQHAVKLLTPGVVFAQHADRYAHAIEMAVPEDLELIFVEGNLEGRHCTTFDTLEKTPVTEQVESAHQAVGHDTIAKFLFTSGSTKLPKAVVNTHGMLTSNQQMFIQCYLFAKDDPPVLVDWLPWHHTAAGNNNFGIVLYNGGTMYIDDGKPTPDGMAETIRNLREIPSTIHYTVPKGLEMLAHAMKRDTALREQFFKNLKLIFPCGAALPGPLKQTIDELAIQTVGMRIPMTTALGQTETAPFAITAHLPDWQAGVIGNPAPGCEVKLAPVADKLEVRYKGPNITPGYWRQPELTAEAFDEEGYFCSGDAATFIDPEHPEEGLRFDGRIAEDFKLISGTWVNVGALRSSIIAAGAPYIHDAVITGHDRDELGMMLFLLPAATALSPALNDNAGTQDIADNPDVQRWAQNLLNELGAKATGSSNRITRAIILRDPPVMELGEMTDKGSINQRTVLRTRAELVEQLYTDKPGSTVLRLQDRMATS
ncbi:MAG: feruloyl-CoA synthase [Pusillimonas sp.]|nr:feruloyl-CoA synthase [Pusillimonas sp.]|tara:strand:+ start:57740 stop:59611 length:1872 start_codon:yes stop_codon:yes gene_type:complete